MDMNIQEFFDENPREALIALLQLRGEGLITREECRAMLPFNIPDVPPEPARVEAVSRPTVCRCGHI